jgi:hypothetical protein
MASCRTSNWKNHAISYCKSHKKSICHDWKVDFHLWCVVHEFGDKTKIKKNLKELKRRLWEIEGIIDEWTVSGEFELSDKDLYDTFRSNYLTLLTDFDDGRLEDTEKLYSIQKDSFELIQDLYDSPLYFHFLRFKHERSLINEEESQWLNRELIEIEAEKLFKERAEELYFSFMIKEQAEKARLQNEIFEVK